MSAFETAAYGFETAREILDLGPNAMAKVIKLNLLSIYPDGASKRNQRYAGWDIGYLASARHNPLLIPDGEKALVCSMGAPNSTERPTPYFDQTWATRTEEMREVHDQVDQETWDKIRTGQLHVIGHWRVNQEDVDHLVGGQNIFVASYAGFILEGGRIVQSLHSQISQTGGRYFLIRPFGLHERHQYAHCYLTSRKGANSRVYTSDELREEAREI